MATQIQKRAKAFERRVARRFGTERTPLSGENSRLAEKRRAQ